MQNFPSRLLHCGDNLPFMQSMNSESVDLIATDPPFNKGRDFHATPDSLADGGKFKDRWSWKADVHDDWMNDISTKHPKLWGSIMAAYHGHSEGMGAFCCFLGVRLLEMHRLLKPTGGIYLHCDDTASHWIRTMMDSIFGARNFLNEITWQRTNGGKVNATKKFARNTDRILYYSKTKAHGFNPIYKDQSEAHQARHYRFDDNDGRGVYMKQAMRAPSRNGYRYDFEGFPPPADGFRCPKETMQQLADENRLIYPKKPDGEIYKKVYKDETNGTPLSDIWTDIDRLNGMAKERCKWPTQKPVELYQRMILASSNEGDIVFDPFAGCATTVVAAERNGRKWVAADLWEGAPDLMLEQISKLIFWGKKAGIPIAKDWIKVTKETLTRTDNKRVESKAFKTPTLRLESPEPPFRKEEMKKKLLERDGMVCRGCGFVPPDPRFLTVDHLIPRCDGGSNRIENLALLCSPCNSKKGPYLTISGLRRDNKKEGLLLGELP